MKTGFSFWQRRDFVVHLIVECLSALASEISYLRSAVAGEIGISFRSIAIDIFFSLTNVVDRSRTWTTVERLERRKKNNLMLCIRRNNATGREQQSRTHLHSSRAMLLCWSFFLWCGASLYESLLRKESLLAALMLKMRTQRLSVCPHVTCTL